jgi:hypothetical protein
MYYIKGENIFSPLKLQPIEHLDHQTFKKGN